MLLLERFDQLSADTERWHDESVKELKRYFDIASESLVRDFNGAHLDSLALVEDRQKRCERRVRRLEQFVSGNV